METIIAAIILSIWSICFIVTVVYLYKEKHKTSTSYNNHMKINIMERPYNTLDAQEERNQGFDIAKEKLLDLVEDYLNCIMDDHPARKSKTMKSQND